MKISISSKVVFWSILCLLFLESQNAYGQQKTIDRGVIVDDNGVMRWQDNEEEIHGFGANYTTPFAHAYRSAKKLGVDPLQAIDEDVYHFARLGFDLYRVHVWDTEISDTLGNLLYNENLHAFDYLLHQLQKRGVNYVLTPIAFWGNGWPEPDEKTPGFSSKYGKGNCLTEPEAIKAQENYLYQFLNHINPYSGVAYKDDPHLIAVEISNEPHHREEPEMVTRFIQRMVDAVRKTGFEKPVFYNISHSVHLAEDYFKADIQGGTFQWYPTGLGYQQELPGNFLPNVDDYNIPFKAIIQKNKGAKLVYEFDAADVGKSYIYPAMARSFREAGIQIATHFSYDPMFLAYANTEYNTHYMNLAYTPQKALSLKICSEIFHRIPMHKDFGTYPDNTQFEGFSVNYEQDLAQLNISDRFFYTNHTNSQPVDENRLKHIAGFGNAPIVEYDGAGAYFLDQLENGVWRLEVMPDALVIANPYGRNGLDKTVCVIQWNERTMHIKLKDLGADFSITTLNEHNDYQTTLTEGVFKIKPGAYLLEKKGITSKWKPEDEWNNIKLKEFYAPPSTVKQTHLVHQHPEMAIENVPLTISAKVISSSPIAEVQLMVQGGFRGRPMTMEAVAPFTYEVTLPKERLQKGFLSYYLIVKTGEGTISYPAEKEGLPFQWDFYERHPYTVRVLGKDQTIPLFSAEKDWSTLSRSRWMNSLKLVPTNLPHESEYLVNVEALYQKDNENLNGSIIHDYTLRHYLNPKIDPIRNQLNGKTKLVLKANALNEKPVPVQLALITKVGSSFGQSVRVEPGKNTYEIMLADLKPVPTVTMPRPYPTFLPYYFEGKGKFDLQTIEGLQISIGPGIPKDQLEQAHGIGLISISLE